MPRIYKDVIIKRANKNASGIKYYAFIKGVRVMSDTLKGIKEMITHTKNS